MSKVSRAKRDGSAAWRRRARSPACWDRSERREESEEFISCVSVLAKE